MGKGDEKNRTAVGDEAGAAGTSAGTHAASGDSVEESARVNVTRTLDSGDVEVHFNPSVALQSYVMEDGTEVSEGDRVKSDVADKLGSVKLDGYDLLSKEAE